jgi:hypothetical protein
VKSEPYKPTKEEEEKMKEQKKKTFDQTPRIGDLLGCARVRRLYNMMANRFTVNEILTGGGGNDRGLQCLCMCVDILTAMVNREQEALSMDWAVEKLRP